MAIQIDCEDDGLICVRGSGAITRADFDAAKKQVIALIKQIGKIYVLIRIGDDFASFEGMPVHDDEDDEFLQRYVNRMAIVGPSAWSEEALLFFLSGLVPFEIKYFSDEAFAKAWLVD